MKTLTISQIEHTENKTFRLWYVNRKNKSNEIPINKFALIRAMERRGIEKINVLTDFLGVITVKF